MTDNGFWKVCEALDSPSRLELLRHLMAIEKTEFPCVSELADHFNATEPAMSVHLKKLANVGLVASKRADGRVYYRASPTTPEGARVIEALRSLFSRHPTESRKNRLLEYAHALSHYRRHAIVRCLHAAPGLPLKELSQRTDMPPPTACRLLGSDSLIRTANLHKSRGEYAIIQPWSRAEQRKNAKWRALCGACP